MRILYISLVAIGFLSCGGKGKKWSKEALNKECIENFKENEKQINAFNETQLTSLCDCVTGKMLSRYKSYEEMDKEENRPEIEEIGMNCALELLEQQKSSQQ